MRNRERERERERERGHMLERCKVLTKYSQLYLL